jgi:hypothetical protein
VRQEAGERPLDETRAQHNAKNARTSICDEQRERAGERLGNQHDGIRWKSIADPLG